MKNVKPRLARTSNAERALEGAAACLREIDRAYDLPNRCHVGASSSVPMCLLRCSAILRRRQHDAESPRRRVTGRERIREDPIDVVFLCAGARRLFVRPARDISFRSATRAFHVRPAFACSAISARVTLREYPGTSARTGKLRLLGGPPARFTLTGRSVNTLHFRGHKPRGVQYADRSTLPLCNVRTGQPRLADHTVCRRAEHDGAHRERSQKSQCRTTAAPRTCRIIPQRDVAFRPRS